MDSNTLLRIGLALFAFTAALAGCSRKTDETPAATQPTAATAVTAQHAPSEATAAPTEDQIEAARLAMQPPLRELTDRACVVYALN